MAAGLASVDLLAAIAIEFILDGIAGHFPDIVMIEH